MFFAKLKYKELVNKSDISNLVKRSSLNRTLAAWATIAERNKIVKLQTYDLFSWQFLFVCDMILKMFISQQLIQLQLKKKRQGHWLCSQFEIKGNIIGPLYTALSYSIKLFGYKMRINYDKEYLYCLGFRYMTKNSS